MAKPTEKQIENLQKLLRICLDISRPDFEVSFNFSGVGCSLLQPHFSLSVYHGGWRKGDISNVRYPVGHAMSIGKAEEAIVKLIEASEENASIIEFMKSDEELSLYRSLQEKYGNEV